ncbi:site-specific integrase [Pedobacter gandavensis]|uniref:site-specific integrase n=1 Tax=Pedobacter gandavensis TaxID=2679963 RepID=UPI00247A862E|nr:site-specific integrase [Pedobacter gandavensis]WGQ10830.1 site-specific integrase [Pedobacter gandavensis]
MAKVKMRMRTIVNNRKSIVLDYSPPIKNPASGKLHRFETLKLYIYDEPADQWEKQHNKETMILARTVCAQRQLDIQNRRFAFISDAIKNSSFIDFFTSETRKKQQSLSDDWSMGLRYFIAFAGHDLMFPELSDYLCEDYKIYLLSGPGISRTGRPIKRNTAVCYYAKLRYVLRIAYKRGIISQDLYSTVKPITPKETHRERLTLEEFQLLAETPADCDLMKRAALFSGLTGLRFSDVSTLKWSEVRGTVGKYELQFSQEKTDSAEVMPISDQAVFFMGDQNTDNVLVFQGLRYSRLRTFFTHWLTAAGITKNITFHSFRHTFATLQLELGTDIYTVSKMLGHKAFKNTEIYAKIVDKTKRKAADKVMLKMPEEVVKVELDENLPPKSFKFIVHRNER